MSLIFGFKVMRAPPGTTAKPARCVAECWIDPDGDEVSYTRYGVNGMPLETSRGTMADLLGHITKATAQDAPKKA